MSYLPPYRHSSGNIKVELDLSNYAAKDDVKNITHVDARKFALKTNLAALKSEIDKIDTDKLKTVPGDLAKLSNVVKNDTVKVTDYNAKISEINKKIPDITNLATKSSVTTLVNELDDKIDEIDTSTLASKSSLSNYILTTTFNNKSTELKKTNDNDTKITGVKNDLSAYAKKSDVADDITKIKNDYMTTASLTSKLNDLKSQHIAEEVKKVDDKAKKNASDILGFESRLKQKEDTLNEVQRDASFVRGLNYYMNESYLLFECKRWSFSFNDSGKIKIWKSTDIDNLTRDTDLDAVPDSSLLLPILENSGRINVKLDGNYFKQTKIIAPNVDKCINIYIVYALDPISNTRNTDYTIQNALYGGVSITKNADSKKKNEYEGYGLCFDEGGTFSVGNITNGRNVIIFGVHESLLTHANNKNNNI